MCTKQTPCDVNVATLRLPRHFNLPGNSKWDMKATVLEKVHDRVVWVREERESLFIRNSNTYYKGMNTEP